MRANMVAIQGLCPGTQSLYTNINQNLIRDLVQRAVKDKSLDTLLEQARAENPLKDPPTLAEAERQHS